MYLRLLARLLADASLDVRGPHHELARVVARGAADSEEIVRLADQQRVLPAVGPALRRLGLAGMFSHDVLDLLDLVASANADRNRRLRAQLIEAIERLNTSGIEPVLLKGSIRLLDGLYPDLAWRVMGDLDLLVPPGRAAEAQASLIAIGYSEIAGKRLPSDHHHLMPLIAADHPAFVEIHRAVSARSVERILPTAHVRAGAARWALDQARFHVPATVDQLIHLVGHRQMHHFAFASGRVSIRDLLEYRLLTRREPSAEAIVVDAFRAAGRSTTIAAWSALAGRLFDATSDGRSDTVSVFLATAALRQASRPRLDRLRHFLARWIAHIGELRDSRIRRRRLLTKLRSPAWYAQHWTKIMGRGGKVPPH